MNEPATPMPLSKADLIHTLTPLNTEQQIRWMLSLGHALTISARSSYKTDTDPGRIEGVMGHNEIQHRLFARIRDLSAGCEWTTESFINLLLETGKSYGVAGDIGWAIRQSLRALDSPSS